uniref:Conotoxin Cal5a L3 n=1 Tax=Californiconus californicus TaxID=1736779 RepID=CU51C_CONCL|nr:RecName: Full=Conotoxin Cal5a L3; Contains: RecName: Full=Conotoxin Cal5b L3; Contains: RecName: Full=Conotoxin Cal5.1; Flags: Precursor [Californiconus californicus]ADB43126.1 conotoxin Cal 5.1 precursor [Californiconus californicus]
MRFYIGLMAALMLTSVLRTDSASVGQTGTKSELAVIERVIRQRDAADVKPVARQNEGPGRDPAPCCQHPIETCCRR